MFSPALAITVELLISPVGVIVFLFVLSQEANETANKKVDTIKNNLLIFLDYFGQFYNLLHLRHQINRHAY